MGSALIEKAAGVEMLHVPYSGVAPAMNALLGRHDRLRARHAADGQAVHRLPAQFRAIATTGKERHPLFPTCRRCEEAGLPVTVVVWYGILAPAGTPEPVLARLRKEVADVLKDPKVLQRLTTLGYQVSYLPGDEFKAFVMKDADQWKEVARTAKIVVE